jgi:hypothetical protein
VDIGSSVDSILSLFLLLASSEKDIEIVGITTSYIPLGPDQVECAGISVHYFLIKTFAC